MLGHCLDILVNPLTRSDSLDQRSPLIHYRRGIDSNVRHWLPRPTAATIERAPTSPPRRVMQRLLPWLLLIFAAVAAAEPRTYAGHDDALRGVDSADPGQRADAIKWIASHGTQ